MPLLVINADMKRVAEALEKIAELLELAIRPPAPEEVTPSTLEDLHEYSFDAQPPDEEDLWMTYGPRKDR